MCINIVCTANEAFYNDTPPIPMHLLGKVASTNRTVIGTKMAEAFASIFTGEIEKQSLNESANKLLTWKRYIDDIISLWHISRDLVGKFIEQANKHHLTTKFTDEIDIIDATKDSTKTQFSM